MLAGMARGSKRKRGDAWQLRVYIGQDTAGRDRYVSRSVRGTEKDADRALRRLLDEYDTDSRRVPTDITVAEWIDRWIALRSAEGLAASTIRGYQAKVHWITDPIGRRPLDRLGPADVERVLTHLAGHDVAQWSRRQTWNILRGALDAAVQRGLLHRNPCLDVRAPRTPATRPDPPGPEIVPAVLQAADSDSHLCTAPFVRLALATGARRGELLGLMWRDIDRKHRRVWIGRTVTRTLKGDLVTKETKTSAQAWVTVNGDTLDALERHRVQMAERALAVGAPLNGDRFVFSDEPACRRPFDPSWATHAWARVREASRVNMRLHDLRHFSATYLLDQGVPLPEVSARLRHAQTSTTVQFYAGRTSGMNDAATAALEDLFERGAAAPDRRPGEGR